MREDYQTENLWSVGDMENWDCDDEQALDILHDALTNDTTMESIWFAIGQNLILFNISFFLF